MNPITVWGMERGNIAFILNSISLSTNVLFAQLPSKAIFQRERLKVNIVENDSNKLGLINQYGSASKQLFVTKLTVFYFEKQ